MGEVKEKGIVFASYFCKAKIAWQSNRCVFQKETTRLDRHSCHCKSNGSFAMTECDGQAMLEFVIFLTVIMAMCIGMLVSMRLLNFQFWAQQNARYLAYEQTWAAREYYNLTGEQPIDLHARGNAYGGPKQLSRINSIKRVSFGRSASSILSWLFKEDRDFLEKSRENLSLVNTAYARELSREKVGEIIIKDHKNIKQTKLEKDLEGFLIKTDFAKKVCGNLRNFSQNKKIDLIGAFINCEETLNTDFAKQLSRNLNFKTLLEQYQLRIEQGDKPIKAIKDIVRQELTEQYYSLFDNKVKQARAPATAVIIAGFQNAAQTFNGFSVNQILNQGRYISSADAVQGIIDVSVGVLNPNSLFAVSEERDRAISFGAYLFDNAKDQFDEDAYNFKQSYLPVPPAFGSEGIRMQEVVMSSILGGLPEPGLSQDDADLRDSIINKSAKYIEVNYRAKHGLFPAAAKWLSSTREIELTAKHYLITQPWHITRRDRSGNYRDKGTQFDSINSFSEEGALRRRTFGLWLYPSEFSNFTSPIFNLAGLGAVSNALQSFAPAFDHFLNEIKSALINNPFQTLADALNNIPGVGGIFPEPPQFPAVRPDAYPRSRELSGNQRGSPDLMIKNRRRDFQDYVNEQRQLNPQPEPRYN